MNKKTGDEIQTQIQYKLIEELRSRVQRQEMIAELSQLALVSHVSKAFFIKVVEAVSRSLNAEYCVFTKNLSGSLHVEAGIGLKKGSMGRRLDETGLSIEDFRDIVNHPAVISDFGEERCSIAFSALFERKISSGVILTIGKGKGVFGVLGAFTSQKRIFTDDDMLFLQALTNIIASFMERGVIDDALKDSMERFRSLVEATNDWIWQVDENSLYTYSSPQVRDILGYEVEEVLGKTPFDLMPPDEAKRVSAVFGPLIARHRVLNGLENINRHKNGRMVVLETNGVPFFDASGTFKGYRGIDRDISERRRYEEAFRSVYEAAVLWRGSLADLCDQVVTKLSQLFNVSHVIVEQLEGRKIKVISMMAEGKIVHGGELNLDGSPCENVHDDKKTCQYNGSLKEMFPGDLFFQDNDLHSYLGLPIFDSLGSVIGVVLTMDWSERIFTEGEIHLLEIIARMISNEMERAKVEAQLIQAQKMEAVGQLAGGIAHDFNNLMTVIQGNVDLALLNTREGSPIYENLREVRRVSTHAATLTRQLLAFSSSRPKEKETLNVNKIIEEFSKMLKRLVGENISISTDLEQDVWNVDADSGQIGQVLMNLVVNARDAMPEGGELFIRTKNLSIEEAYPYKESRPGRFVCISVEDTGLGMDAETSSHIFEPFYTTKGMDKGTGLGLSVVYGIVKGHDGWINVYSEPGKGTNFQLCLPAVAADIKKAGARKEAAEYLGGNERILLVEDEKDVRDLALLMLERYGYTVSDASTFEEAVSIFKSEGEKDLLITDMILTDKTGLELARELKRLKPGLPVLFSSGYGSEHFHIPEELKRDSFFIEKPYTMQDFIRKVRGVLDNKID